MEIRELSDFLAARRELLAQAANDFLDSLYSGNIPESEPVDDVLTRETDVILETSPGDAEEQALQACNRWVTEQQLPAGELAYNLTQSETNETLAILDIAWPDGLQPGYSQPVALLLNEDSETRQ